MKHSITALTPAIKNLDRELTLLLDRIGKEPPRAGQATREISLTPELMNLTGSTDLAGNADFSLHGHEL